MSEIYNNISRKIVKEIIYPSVPYYLHTDNRMDSFYRLLLYVYNKKHSIQQKINSAFENYINER
jgi:hypothetical protein